MNLFLSVQFRDIRCFHAVAQPSLQFISRSSPSSPRDTLYPNNNFTFLSNQSFTTLFFLYTFTVAVFYRPGPGNQSRLKRKREKERAVSLGLHGKPTKPMHRTCTAHKGSGHLLKEVLTTQARKWAQQASTLRREWRQKEGHGGPRSLVEQGYFIRRNAGLYIFSKMITQLLQRTKFHQLQQNG